jgi:hypothetical protein
MEGLVFSVVHRMQGSFGVSNPEGMPPAFHIPHKAMIIDDPILIIPSGSEHSRVRSGEDIARGSIDVDIVTTDHGNRDR